MKIVVRPERDADVAAVRAVHAAAFPTEAEADLVERLHHDLDSAISLVAFVAGKLVGHVLMSRMRAEGDGRQFRALGLAPVAVLPERQGQGVGSALIRKALALAESNREQLVFLVGEPEYYQRFGFAAETAAPFASPYAGPYFMALNLAGIALPRSGRAEYAPAFAGLE